MIGIGIRAKKGKKKKRKRKEEETLNLPLPPAAAAATNECRGVSSRRVDLYAFPICKSEPKPRRLFARRRKTDRYSSSSAAPTRHPLPAFRRPSPSRLRQPSSITSQQIALRSLSHWPSFAVVPVIPTRASLHKTEPNPRLRPENPTHTSSRPCARVKPSRQLPAAHTSLQAAHEEVKPPPSRAHARAVHVPPSRARLSEPNSLLPVKSPTIFEPPSLFLVLSHLFLEHLGPIDFRSVEFLQLRAQALQPRPRVFLWVHRRPIIVPSGSHDARVRERASSWAGAEVRQGQGGKRPEVIVTSHRDLLLPLYIRSSGSVERTHQSRDLEGCTYQSSDPEGYTYQSSDPEGCTYQSSDPGGCTYQSSDPEGYTYQRSENGATRRLNAGVVKPTETEDVDRDACRRERWRDGGSVGFVKLKTKKEKEKRMGGDVCRRAR
ncbi:NBS-LRR type resistance protein [Cucumis melo var. makuwa]|uniref:NBS-LRR type resistance protein n=1 Tax=Cucumis melo var. makuwa TaxID=1194695 RepID=A0A5D3DRP8_CUCMM|nr:NBS-LRR type resistance protein [Cucumis melo var. makuwa]